jgi:hypothetical protein
MGLVTAKIIIKAVTAPVFLQYIQMFEADQLKYTGKVDGKSRSVQITFVNHSEDRKKLEGLGSDYLGYCEVATKQIRIDEKKWRKLSQVSKRLLIYHELGHCALGFEHTDKPNRLMNPELLSGQAFKREKDRILFQFFNKPRDY